MEQGPRDRFVALALQGCIQASAFRRLLILRGRLLDRLRIFDGGPAGAPDVQVEVFITLLLFDGLHSTHLRMQPARSEGMLHSASCVPVCGIDKGFAGVELVAELCATLSGLPLVVRHVLPRLVEDGVPGTASVSFAIISRTGRMVAKKLHTTSLHIAGGGPPVSPWGPASERSDQECHDEEGDPRDSCASPAFQPQPSSPNRRGRGPRAGSGATTQNVARELIVGVV
mmetsp:Transcript_75269/g.161239  ORF Transcript_75269/g.161239 Transcript_75269/m.161239 type:complete len:228 (+) Transcript_75269:1333-2016(+)